MLNSTPDTYPGIEIYQKDRMDISDIATGSQTPGRALSELRDSFILFDQPREIIRSRKRHKAGLPGGLVEELRRLVSREATEVISSSIRDGYDFLLQVYLASEENAFLVLDCLSDDGRCLKAIFDLKKTPAVKSAGPGSRLRVRRPWFGRRIRAS